MVKDSNLSSCFNYFASTDITAKTERNICFKADLQNNEFYKAEVGDRIGRRQTAVLVLAGAELCICVFQHLPLCITDFTFFL